MKLHNILIVVCSIVAFTTCSDKQTPAYNNTGNRTSALVGLSMLLYQHSQAGLNGYMESVNEVTAKGINLFGMSPEWNELEPSTGTYNLHDALVNPLTLLDPDNTKFKAYILVLKMIDTRRKTVPADLINTSFDDTQLINRFNNLIDTISKLPSFNKISYILLGNEVDGYLGEHSSELNAFNVFYKQAVEHIHTVMPNVKAGTIITYNSLIGDINIFNTLLPYSDFICYTYYPTNLSNDNWQMRQPIEVFNDVKLMATKAGNKPFAFSEIGYASSADNNSSETLQQDFVKNMFAALQPYKKSKQLEFIFYHGLYDYPPGFCTEYAQLQQINAEYLCGFMNSLGLKYYASGNPKKAYKEFFDDLKSW